MVNGETDKALSNYTILWDIQTDIDTDINLPPISSYSPENPHTATIWLSFWEASLWLFLPLLVLQNPTSLTRLQAPGMQRYIFFPHLLLSPPPSIRCLLQAGHRAALLGQTDLNTWIKDHIKNKAILLLSLECLCNTLLQWLRILSKMAKFRWLILASKPSQSRGWVLYKYLQCGPEALYSKRKTGGTLIWRKIKMKPTGFRG